MLWLSALCSACCCAANDYRLTCFGRLRLVKEIAASPDEKRLCPTAAPAESACGGARDLLRSYSALNCVSSLTLSISALHEKP